MDELFNAAWSNVGLNSDSADWLLADGTQQGAYAVDNAAVSAPKSSESWLGNIWSTLTGTATKVVDYWGQSVVASNAPEYVVSGSNPYPYRQAPVDQEAAQSATPTGLSSGAWLTIGGILAAVAVVALVSK